MFAGLLSGSTPLLAADSYNAFKEHLRTISPKLLVAKNGQIWSNDPSPCHKSPIHPSIIP